MRTAIPIVIVVLASAARAEPPTWTFDPDQRALRYEVSLKHDEKGNDKDSTKLELSLRLELKSVSDAGDGTWTATVERVKVARTVDGKKIPTFDSAKPRDPAPAVRWFAELHGKQLDLTVSKSGEVKKVAGALRRPPGPGDFLAEGADRAKLVGEALLGEIVVKLFRLPGAAKRGYAYGVVCPLGNAVAGCHLAQEVKAQEAPIRPPREKRTWKSTLHSDGGAIRSGGATLKLTGGSVGGGKGEGVYAPGYLVSLKETVSYDMPTATRTVAFKRRLEIDLAK